MLRALARLGSAVLLTGGGLALATPAQAAGCSASQVTVVVDFGGSAQVHCVGDAATAGQALEAAGYTLTRVQRDPGAVCKINGTPSNLECVVMPPADNYWSLHHASAGGTWEYATKGFFAFNPAPGTVVGASLGAGGAPGIAPPATTSPAPAPTSAPPPPTSTPRPSASPAAPRTSDSTARSTSGGSTGSDSDRSSGADSSAAASSTSSRSASASTDSTKDAKDSTSKDAKKSKDAKDEDEKSTSSSSTSASASSSDDATAAAVDDRTPPEGTIGGNALVPTLVGGALLTALGGGAVVMARRRAD